MKLILEFDEFKNRKSESRTKSLSDTEFLSIFNENCKNFSFENDQLWRRVVNKFGNYGLFIEDERAGTIGDYNYKDFFDNRKDYPVPRYKSLIGSTTKMGANYFGSGNADYLVIPFDDTNIVFAGTPDMAFWDKEHVSYFDELFIMRKYDAGFKVPVNELNTIFSSTSLSHYKTLGKYGFEFFTNGNCLLLHEEKINWLKENI